MQRSKKKPDKAWLALWGNYNSHFADRLLTRYLLKCKMRHELAFYQYRRNFPGAKLGDLQEMFRGTKKHINDIIEISVDLNLQNSDKKGKNKYKLATDDDFYKEMKEEEEKKLETEGRI